MLIFFYVNVSFDYRVISNLKTQMFIPFNVKEIIILEAFLSIIESCSQLKNPKVVNQQKVSKVLTLKQLIAQYELLDFHITRLCQCL